MHPSHEWHGILEVENRTYDEITDMQAFPCVGSQSQRKAPFEICLVRGHEAGNRRISGRLQSGHCCQIFQCLESLRPLRHEVLPSRSSRSPCHLSCSLMPANTAQGSQCLCRSRASWRSKAYAINASPVVSLENCVDAGADLPCPEPAQRQRPLARGWQMPQLSHASFRK